MLPDEMEAEKNRKMIIAQADEIEMLKRNVRDLQKQLQVANGRSAQTPNVWNSMMKGSRIQT